MIDAVEICAELGRVWSCVSGLSDKQWTISVVSRAVEGCIAGVACRARGRRWSWPLLSFFSALQAISGISFGVGPIVKRVEGVGPEVLSAVVTFAPCASVASL